MSEAARASVGDLCVFVRKPLVMPAPRSLAAACVALSEQLVKVSERWLLVRFDGGPSEREKLTIEDLTTYDAYTWLTVNGHPELVHDLDTHWLRRYVRSADDSLVNLILLHAPDWLDERIQRWREQPE